MSSLTDLLKHASLGRIFLGNLHHALVQVPPHIEIDRFRELWLDAQGSLPTLATADDARSHLFEHIYDPRYLPLRFSRAPPGHLGPVFDIHTTVMPFDLVSNEFKQVMDKARIVLELDRGGRAEDDWTDAECLRLCELLFEPYFLNGKPYAHRWRIFWATPDGGSLAYSADDLRDLQGLVDIDVGQPLIQLTFRCRPGFPAHMSSPTALEATAHRRFKARSVTAPPAYATAADLARLRGRALADGLQELTLASIPMTTLTSARFAGRTTKHADISNEAPTGDTRRTDDETFAEMLVADLDPIADYLIATLES